MGLDLTNSVQAQRKAIIAVDTTPLFDDLGAAAGWGTDYTLSDYAIAGGETASLTVLRESYDGETETKVFDLTALGFFEAPQSQANLVYNIVTSNSVMSVVDSSSFDADSFDEILDGLYTLTYTLSEGGSPVTFTEIFLVDKKAESILDEVAINLDTKIFSTNTDLVEVIDINVLEALMYIIQRSNTTSQKQVILDALKVINNSEYEYYRE